MMHIVIETILRKMCEFGGHKYEDFKWLNDDNHINTPYKYEDSEEKFIEWLVNHLYSLKKSELNHIANYPSLVYRNKKRCREVANSFVFNYGFKTFKRNIIEERKEKIERLTK